MYGFPKKSNQKPTEGGLIKGKGTGTSDDIKKNVKDGSFIMPADSTQQIGVDSLENAGKELPLNLSNGEFELTPEQVHGVGAQVLGQIKDQTHTPVDQPQIGIKKDNKPEFFFANGGLVEEEKLKNPLMTQGVQSTLQRGFNRVDKTQPHISSVPGQGLPDFPVERMSSTPVPKQNASLPQRTTVPSVKPVATTQQQGNPSPVRNQLSDKSYNAGYKDNDQVRFEGGVYKYNNPNSKASQPVMTAAQVQQPEQAGIGFKSSRVADAPRLTSEQQLERQRYLNSLSTTIKGARGVTAAQRNAANAFFQNEDRTTTDRYQAQIGNQSQLDREAMSQNAANMRANMSEQGTNARFNAQQNNDSQQFNASYGLKRNEQEFDQKERGFGIRAKDRIEALTKQFDTAKNDEDRQKIAAKIQQLTGDGKSNKDRYMTVNGGQINDPQAGILNQQHRVFDTQTGNFVDSGQPGTPQALQSFEIGKVYTDANGNKATWTGENWEQI